MHEGLQVPSASCAAALGHAELYDVLALPYAPYTAGWPLSGADATQDAERIIGWWREWPDARIGVVVPDHVAVVEISFDADHTEARQYPNTMCSLDDAGTVRLWFVALPGQVPRGETELAAGVRVYGPESVVQIPTSPGHVWVDTCEPALLPAELLDALERAAPERGDSVTRRVVCSGEQDEYLERYARLLLDEGVDPGDLERIVFEHNEAVCRPPHGLWEVRGVVSAVLEAG